MKNWDSWSTAPWLRGIGPGISENWDIWIWQQYITGLIDKSSFEFVNTKNKIELKKVSLDLRMALKEFVHLAKSDSLRPAQWLRRIDSEPHRNREVPLKLGRQATLYVPNYKSGLELVKKVNTNNAFLLITNIYKHLLKEFQRPVFVSYSFRVLQQRARCS